jgi:hypothetical protein
LKEEENDVSGKNCFFFSQLVVVVQAKSEQTTTTSRLVGNLTSIPLLFQPPTKIKSHPV